MRFKRLHELPFPCYGAKVGGYQFLVADVGEGWGSSYQDVTLQRRSAKEIEQSYERPFDTITAAQEACRRQYRKLKGKMS